MSRALKNQSSRNQLLKLNESLCQAITDVEAVHWQGGAVSHELAHVQQQKFVVLSQIAPSQTKIIILSP